MKSIFSRSARANVWGPLILGALALCFSHTAFGFWLLNYQDARTLAPQKLNASAGTSVRWTDIGTPRLSSVTPFVPHAGIRMGIVDSLDVGYRLCTVPSPYNVMTPPIGGALDIKWSLTPSTNPWQAAILAGMAYAYAMTNGVGNSAYGPGGSLILSRNYSPALDFVFEAGYFYTQLPTLTASTTAPSNYFHTLVLGTGAQIALREGTTVFTPEVGILGFMGKMNGVSKNGVGLQLGAVIRTALN